MSKLKLTVPIDASAIDAVEPGHLLKAVAIDAAGKRQVQLVRLDGKKGAATFTFDEQPEGLRVFVGPKDAADDNLVGYQNAAAVSVGARAFAAAGTEVVLPPIAIRLAQWEWWRRWCRPFTVRGKIVCPDGSPVPGARVCAYDVDWFLWWRSTQQVACAMTDANGEFTMTFTWCCGWWPWWWWRLREWQLDVDILERITRLLPAELRVRPIPLPDPAPDLRFIEPLLGNTRPVPALGRPELPTVGLAARPRVGFGSETFDFGRLEATREALAQKLPKATELEALRLWPWYPWAPWFDCAPDLLFRATQDCRQPGAVIVDESPWQTRWNAASPLDVTLVANGNACCVPKQQTGEECLILTQVCDVLTADIGGNVGAPPAPSGFANPGSSGAAGDRPFAGRIDIYGTVETMTGVDYYEIEIAPSGSGTFAPIAPGQLGTFSRAYLDLSTSPLFTWHSPSFAPTLIDGHHVYESRQHYGAVNPGPAWGSASGRIWVGTSAEELFAWATSSPTIADGVYDLRVIGYKLNAGHLEKVPLPICGDKDPSSSSPVTLAIDNRLDPDPTHATYPPHPCGAGTVHSCVTEPDTDIVSVQIVSGGGKNPVDACGQYSLGKDDTVEIQFYVYDPNGHLGAYSFEAWYGNNLFTDLLAFATPVAGPAVGAIPAADAVGPSYVHAADAQWKGGVLKLTLPADAFPKTCCYTLDLRGYKRTIVDCQENVFAHENVSQYSFMITKV
jgi:hypothetical protein